jgi:plasmid stability protein
MNALIAMPSLVSLRQEAPAMASLTIRKLDDRVKTKIRLRAAQNGRSMEEEARQLLSLAISMSATEESGLGTVIRRRFAPHGEFKLIPPARSSRRDAPKFK